MSWEEEAEQSGGKAATEFWLDELASTSCGSWSAKCVCVVCCHHVQTVNNKQNSRSPSGTIHNCDHVSGSPDEDGNNLFAGEEFEKDLALGRVALTRSQGGDFTMRPQQSACRGVRSCVRLFNIVWTKTSHQSVLNSSEFWIDFRWALTTHKPPSMAGI